MKKPASLDTVLDVSRRKRDEALQTLGAAQREWQQAQAQMAQLRAPSRARVGPASDVQGRRSPAARSPSSGVLHGYEP